MDSKLKEARRKWRAAWKKANPRAVQVSRRKYNLSKYGLSPERHAEMLVNQKGKCAICETGFEDSKPLVDHCHVTSRVRGLLCNSCNAVLGFSKDSETTLFAAVDYLRRSNLTD